MTRSGHRARLEKALSSIIDFFFNAIRFRGGRAGGEEARECVAEFGFGLLCGCLLCGETVGLQPSMISYKRPRKLDVPPVPHIFTFEYTQPTDDQGTHTMAPRQVDHTAH